MLSKFVLSYESGTCHFHTWLGNIIIVSPLNFDFSTCIHMMKALFFLRQILLFEYFHNCVELFSFEDFSQNYEDKLADIRIEGKQRCMYIMKYSSNLFDKHQKNKIAFCLLSTHMNALNELKYHRWARDEAEFLTFNGERSCLLPSMSEKNWFLLPKYIFINLQPYIFLMEI